jgi:hypothetical protein
MQKISSRAELHEAILLLETENDITGQIFKEQLILTYVSLKPLNILKNTLHEFSSPSLIEEISGTGIGTLGGFLSRKIFVGTSGNLIRKLLGSVLQLGVTTVVTQNSGLLQSAGSALIQHFFQRKKMNRESRVI